MSLGPDRGCRVADRERDAHAPAREAQGKAVVGIFGSADDALIAAHATVTRGVTSGGAAIVARHVPPSTVVVGVPARVFKVRSQNELRADWLRLRSWAFPDEMLQHSVSILGKHVQ